MLLLALLACSEYEFKGDPLPGDGTDETDGVRTTTDEFLVADRTDILFFGDTSGSMQPELATMASNLDVFLDRLADFGTDWQILAVTGPDGCGRGGILRADTPDYRGVFELGLTTPPGEDLVDEWGLNNVMVAAQQSERGECNEGFLRPAALLHVIFISDEDDNSPHYEEGGEYWRPYVEAVQAAKGDPESVRFSAVSGPVPDGCDGAEPGNGYWEAVATTDGSFISICEDWATRIEDLAATSSMRKTFPLSDAPVSDSISITVDDAPSDGWTWEADTNRVRYGADIAPRAGQTVRITYQPASG